MKKITKLIVPGIVAASSLVAAGGAVVSADTATSTASTNTSQTTSADKPPRGENRAQKDGGVVTTDATVVNAVTASVQAKYSGQTVDRVAKLPDGSYLAFTQSTATGKIIVSLDSSYAITSEKTLPAGAPNGHAPGPSGQQFHGL